MSYFILNKLLYGEISIIGIIFTGILMKKSVPKEGMKAVPRQQRVFISMLGCLIAIFMLDGITWCIDGLSFRGMREIYSICLVLYFILNPLLGYLWNTYVYTKIYNSSRQMIKWMRLYIIPFAINVVLCAASPFTEWIFKIDEAGKYSRGALYPLNMAMSFIYYFISVLALINHVRKNRRLGTNREIKYLFLFPAAPLIGSILQSLIYGISVVYMCTLISFLVIFINVQNEQIFTDAGTGLRNKSYLNIYLNEKLMSLKRNNVIGAILIDLDYFKTLNDTYGHTAGDEALKDVANILNQVFDTNVDCLSRFGGDEFVVLMVRNSEDDIKREISRLKNAADEFNAKGKRQYMLHFSVGFGICRGDEGIENVTLDMLLKTADINMYSDKQINHKTAMKAVAKS